MSRIKQRVILTILTLIFILTNTTSVLAITKPNTLVVQAFDNYKQMSPQEIFDSLPEVSKKDFLDSISKDKVLTEYHNENVKQKVIFSSRQKRSVNALTELNNDLSALNLPVSLRYALMAVGGSISAAIADGPLPVGDIIGLIVGVGASAVIIANWDSVSENSTQIINAFKSAFSSIAYDMEFALSNVLEMAENKDEESGRKLPVQGEAPNSVRERKDSTGKVVQRRYYDQEGKARADEDLSDHGTPIFHSNPHYHTWDWSKGKPVRSKADNWWDFD